MYVKMGLIGSILEWINTKFVFIKELSVLKSVSSSLFINGNTLISYFFVLVMNKRFLMHIYIYLSISDFPISNYSETLIFHKFNNIFYLLYSFY